MNDKIRLGIIGFGAQGSTYAKFITDGLVPSMEIGAICDIDKEKIQLVNNTYPKINTYEDYKIMIKSGNIDAIVTTVPHYLHPEMAMYALDNDIHVMNEKPAGVYTKQVLELNEFAKTKKATYAIMFNQRNNPLYQKIKKIIDNNEIGSIRRTNWIITTWWRPQAYYEQSAWRATWGGEGGGVLVNQAPHQLDLIQWLAGVPKSVYGKVKYGYQRSIIVEDDVTATLDYGNGATGTFITCTHDIIGTDRLEILGDSGKIIVEDSKKCTVYRMPKSETQINAETDIEGVRQLFQGKIDFNSLYNIEIFEENSFWGQQHAGVLENFAQHILNGKELIASGYDGINGVRLANAIHLSSWLNEEVSITNFDDNKYLELLNNKILEEGIFQQRE